ncbi:Protein C29F5.8 [Aphelenchoides avenae]|nr:Protein C29F5.8 [Aphelenchus avenae]
MMTKWSTLFALTASVALSGAAFTKDECGERYGCWSFPEGCESADCDAIVAWQYVDDKVLALDIQAPKSEGSEWIAVGLSKDQRMGDDTVLECVFDAQETGTAHVSHNVARGLNEQLTSASQKLIRKSSASVNDGILTCHIEVDFNTLKELDEEDQPKVHDVTEGGEWTLLFARGPASKDGTKLRHSSRFWSAQPVELCEDCSGSLAVVESAGAR